MRRGLVVALLTIALVATPGLKANAEQRVTNGNGDASAWVSESAVGAEARATDVEAEPVSHHSSGPTTCTYEWMSPEDRDTADHMAALGILEPPGSSQGQWVRKVCTTPTGDSSGQIVWSAQAAPVDPTAVAQQALQSAPLMVSNVGMNPPAGSEQLVNVTTWLWVDGASWRPVTASASVGGVTATVTATPQQIVWSMGDGGQVVCNGPGTPYDSARPNAQPDCSYTYRRSSASAPGGQFVMTATESWRVTWTATGAAGGAFGLVSRSTSMPVRVAESQAVNDRE